MKKLCLFLLVSVALIEQACVKVDSHDLINNTTNNYYFFDSTGHWTNPNPQTSVMNIIVRIDGKVARDQETYVVGSSTHLAFSWDPLPGNTQEVELQIVLEDETSGKELVRNTYHPTTNSFSASINTSLLPHNCNGRLRWTIIPPTSSGKVRVDGVMYVHH